MGTGRLVRRPRRPHSPARLRPPRPRRGRSRPWSRRPRLPRSMFARFHLLPTDPQRNAVERESAKAASGPAAVGGIGAAVVAAARRLFPARLLVAALVDVGVDTSAPTPYGAGTALFRGDARSIRAGDRGWAACLRQDTAPVRALLQIGATLVWANARAVTTLHLGAATIRFVDAGSVRTELLVGTTLIQRIDACAVIALVLIRAAFLRGTARAIRAALARGAAAGLGATDEPARDTDDLVALAAERWHGIRAAVLRRETLGVTGAALLGGAALASLGAGAIRAAAPALVDAVDGAQLPRLLLLLAFLALIFALPLHLDSARVRLAFRWLVAFPPGVDGV